MELQPIAQRQQIGGHGAKGPHEAMAAAVGVAQQHTGHDGLLMNVQATTPRIQHLHASGSSLSRGASERCEGNTSFACVLTSTGEGRQSSVRGHTRISFLIALAAPKRHDLVSLAPLWSMPPIFIRFYVWRRH